METTSYPRLELWGGVECTINRVGDRYFSQLERSGHRTRLSDLERFAELGLRTLRFPLLWEELARDSADELAWDHVDAQLQRIRALGIKPIAGLVHHGSGPRHTSLLDPEFPEKLALFARRVAERHPWIESYTPVNEPLTTARFSALYGHWYPHHRDGLSFARALLNQVRGIVLAMRAIREVTPRAALVQTEDLGKTFSSSRLQYQADFENERRWITWDLLCGRVDRHHPMWSYLRWLGVDEREIDLFTEEPCPPDIVAVNHYVTSERFLDENLRAHPPETHGGNGRDRYADVAAVRMLANGIAGPETLLRETCARYRTPVAVTEAHLGCTRDEQLRWLNEIWHAAEHLRAEGHQIRAVTAWSLLGAFDWSSLLTREQNDYEPAAYDVRGPAPRPTAIAKMISAITQGTDFDHPALDNVGWWHRPLRLLHPVRDRRDTLENTGAECPSAGRITPFTRLPATPVRVARRILVTGGGGRLGRAFRWAADLRGLSAAVLDRNELDIADAAQVRRVLREISPWAVINCAGFSQVDDAEAKQAACFRSNVTGAEILARACAKSGVPLVSFSSDFVFNGAQPQPYSERDAVDPLNFYGESKAAAEERIFRHCPTALVIRPGKVFAPLEAGDFLRNALATIARGDYAFAADDIHLSLSHLIDLVTAVLDLLIDGETGIWHLANAGSVTPEELLVRAATFAGLDATLVKAVPAWTLNRGAMRPRNRALASERGQLLPPLDDALQRFVGDIRPILAQAERLVAAR